MANLSGFRYQRIFTKIWTDDKFMALKSDDSRYLFLYLLSSPHSNMIGLYKLPLKYIQADLNWELKRFTEPFAELLRERFIQYDEKTSVLLICNHLKHNPIENQNQVTAAVRIIESLPESSIILDTLEPLNKPFHKPLVELLQQRLGKPVSSYQLEVKSNKDSKTLVQPPKKKDITSSLQDSFNAFYTAYPRKVGKEAALKAWKKLNPDDSLLQTILQAIEIAKQSEAWNKDRQFIPHPATWLNGKRWEDELTAGETQQPVPEPLSKDSILKWYQYSDSITDVSGICIQPGKEDVVQAWSEKNEYLFYKEKPRTAHEWEKFVLSLNFRNPKKERTVV